MPNNDILDDLLVRPDKAVRKAEGVVEPARSSQGDESGYDLTNPNLHHGAEAKYAPTLQVVSKSGSIAAPAEEAFHEGRAIGGSSHLAVGDSAPTATATADQSAFRRPQLLAQCLKPLQSSHRRRCPDLLGQAADRPQHRCPYRHHLGHPDRQRLRQQPDHGDGDRCPRSGDQRELLSCRQRQRSDRHRHRRPERL